MMAYQRLHFRSLFLHLGTHRLGRRASGASISKRLLCSYDCESLFGYSWQHPESNISSNIASKVGANLHLRQGHPLNIVKKIIEDHYITLDPEYQVFDNLEPLVSTEANFDSLLIPGDHVSRSKSDTYYLRNDAVLRTHTSAHQVELLRQGKKKFLVTGDVYRRDEVDRSHYPIFHQMEGVKIFAGSDIPLKDKAGVVRAVELDLKESLEGMARKLFGEVETRWVEAYFPFTDPSFELEVNFQGEWLEVLGCGVIHEDILRNADRVNQTGWAFGLGLERLSMVLFQIPDIRLFWTEDPRFLDQFKVGEVVTFEPYSKYPPCLKDISFWINDAFHPNDLFEVVRDVAGDLVEHVELIDEFSHPTTGKLSNCFRITFRSMDRSLTNEEVDDLQERIRKSVAHDLRLELR